ncbi:MULTISPECIES: phosphopantetheine-binding protein [Atopobiaceae]|uniref:Acyl carrier protein n=1 Tax=Parafannyhessea umbonata TaxID=604330 RepID=A0A1H6JYA4_9ACTN|nr:MULTISPECIES: phosphopantetheine-binding protein [Atopobiaceae]SEH67620.1 acyl carrier protein [Parafannyhessea umbonata]SJZ88733.1 acyl carrier protein [Olsenella sp. KH1P3]
MERSEIFAKVAEAIKETMGDDSLEISESSTLKDLGADSFDQLEIMVALEEAFDITLEDAAEDMSSVETVGQTVDIVSSQL